MYLTGGSWGSVVLHGRKAWPQQQQQEAGWHLASILRKQSDQEVGLGHRAPQPFSSDTPCPIMLLFLKVSQPSQTALPARKQVFKVVKPMGTVHIQITTSVRGEPGTGSPVAVQLCS